MKSQKVETQSQQAAKKDFIGIEDKVPFKRGLPLSIQHLFAMFGASVLVPILFNIDPATVFLFNGIGTIIYAILTKRKIPAFLGSSFAFIAPVLMLQKNGFSFAEIQSGFVVSGLIFAGVGLIVAFTGTGWINKIFPPASMGAIIVIIGLSMAGNAAKDSGFSMNGSAANPLHILIAMITLVTIILTTVLCKGFLKIIPILIGIIVGYLVSMAFGIVDLTEVKSASFLAIPHMQIVKFNMDAILTIIPVTLVVIAENIGHLAVTSSVVGKDLAKEPGLHRSLLGDGISTVISGFFGSVPTTTYGENIGVMAISKVYSVYIIAGAGVLSIILAFSGTLAMLIKSIPQPVIGGVSILLFGSIAASGIRTFVEAKVDYSKARNLVLTSVVFIVGISGMSVNIGSVDLSGMGLATIVAVILSGSFIIFDKLGIMNEKPDSLENIYNETPDI
ncbi:uracil permease [uncultured Clostridium sp.]|jgi:uracil permease|uniref:uracil permease n=1 Tax=uncultured Clostridium sp. TaxID=59620 RepID=UPI002605D741|nr:uracil permease [uncultured Clostridium sp.]